MNIIRFIQIAAVLLITLTEFVAAEVILCDYSSAEVELKILDLTKKIENNKLPGRLTISWKDKKTSILTLSTNVGNLMGCLAEGLASSSNKNSIIVNDSITVEFEGKGLGITIFFIVEGRLTRISLTRMETVEMIKKILEHYQYSKSGF